MKEKFDWKSSQYGYMIWYSLCVLMLGVIDQRRGSARGDIQILFANLVCVVLFFFLVPSLKRVYFRRRGTIIQIAISVLLYAILWMIARAFVKDPGLHITGPLNIICIAFLITYIWWDRKEIFGNFCLYKGRYGILMLCLFLMLLSVNKTVWPGLYLAFFGCFYLIGIPEERREPCILGILVGIALWFVIQQGLAYAFRPYDYVRYKGGLWGRDAEWCILYDCLLCIYRSYFIWNV